ncbi:MAG: penicillin acylase family protein [bacterium]
MVRSSGRSRRSRSVRPGRAAVLVLLVFVTSLGLAGCAGGAPSGDAPAAEAELPESGAEILWDEWGIPHVRAADARALFYAYGWVQAHDHPELLLRNYGEARARAAEYWGREHLEDDLWYRLAGLPGWTERAYASLDEEMRGWVDAFAAGADAFYREHPEDVPESVAPVLPVTGTDVMANAGAVGLRFSDARGARERWRASREGESAGGAADRAALQGFEPPSSAGAAAMPGSNAWAVAPPKAAGGALLLANPHLPWGGNLTWTEAHLTAPGVDVYGASLVGFPVINIGFNHHLGWTHTVNTQDTEDYYELSVVETPDGSGLGYPLGDEVRAFEREVVELRVRTADGFRTEELELLRSVHGPVIARTEGRALALRRVHEVTGGLAKALRQWWEMGRARSLESFERALEHNAVVGQNVTYADADGNIAYYYGAATPVRPRGDVDFWRGVVPGDDEELLWTEVHPFDEMPRVVNPRSGWVQNANDPPWIATWPPELSAERYPPYFAPVDLAMRPQRSIGLLRENGSIDFDEMVRLKHSTRMELADRILPELLEAGREHGGDDVDEAIEVLAEWDRTADTDSRGGVLFQAWAQAAEERARREGVEVFERPWNPDEPLATPDGLGDPASAAAALEAAARRVEAAFGELGVPWGEANRLRRDDVDLPGNGGPGGLGIFRVAFYAGNDEGPRVAAGGDSFVAVVELGERLRASALIPYGNASRPGSSHRTDQLELFAEQRLRPVHFDPAEVEARAVERTALPAPGS